MQVMITITPQGATQEAATRELARVLDTLAQQIHTEADAGVLIGAAPFRTIHGAGGPCGALLVVKRDV